ncbi:MAG TPA: HlyD family efflux transporter periplasmic adaptor subunit, partial [Candidatus Polarisedimenticolaceae bacterium]|nr:HlyD family efflux transporter periplasmic adaptor subunit [Candidatus Polarisedimenticolaceae bacterium]
APVEGVLLTPRLQERTGELLEVGALLCTLADTRHLRVEVAVREGDAEVLVRPKPEGSLLAALKFNAFPEADFRADINHVRAAAEVIDGARSLVAEGEVRDPGATGDLLKPGMTGYARIYAGSKPLIVLLLRRPYRFLRGMIWL